jgi:transcriptional regulator with XRE-family HTH domain
MITGAQIRAARLLLGWSQSQLAKESRVSESTIRRVENGVIGVRENTFATVGVTLLNAGVHCRRGAPAGGQAG